MLGTRAKFAKDAWMGLQNPGCVCRTVAGLGMDLQLPRGGFQPTMAPKGVQCRFVPLGGGGSLTEYSLHCTPALNIGVGHSAALRAHFVSSTHKMHPQ